MATLGNAQQRRHMAIGRVSAWSSNRKSKALSLDRRAHHDDLSPTRDAVSVGYECLKPLEDDLKGADRSSRGILEGIGKVAHFGIHIIGVRPGSFRTYWAGRSMTRVGRSISDSDKLFDLILEARQETSSHQLADPAKAGLAPV